MKVLFVLQDNFDNNYGGMAVQMRSYMSGLSALGLEVSKATVTEFSKGIKEDYNIVHLCDVSIAYDIPLLLDGIAKLDRNITKVVLSTVYWDFDDYYRHGAYRFQRIVYKMFGSNFVDRLSSFVKFIKSKEMRFWRGVWNNRRALQKRIGDSVDLLLPNSSSEGDLFKELTGCSTPYMVINNGLDINLSTMSLVKDIDVLCVARIDKRKNQLQVAESFINTKYKVLFAGPIGPNSARYAKELLDIINKNDNLKYLGSLEQNELFNLYGRARYHCLLSWVETPGLVNLEAFSCGAEVIVADKGSVRDYLGDAAHYVEIGQNNELLKVLKEGRKVDNIHRKELEDKIINEYNWKLIVQNLQKVYKEITI
jgi:glycosyltransferase involved in cell wall biosynthesis